MSNWQECQIEDVFEVARGGSPRPIDNYITDDPGGINWIMIGDAAEGSKYITSTKKKIKTTGLKKSRMVYPGDFLLTNSMSFGRPYINQVEGCIHDGWLVLSPRNKNDIDFDYFYYLLASPTFKRLFAKQAAGAVVKNLNTSIVKQLPIRLPEDVEEQRRIASILDKADAIRRKREQALTLADDLLKSTFLDMFGNPVTNPNGFDQKPLDKCAHFVSGATPSKSNPAYWDGDFPWVSPKDMKVDVIHDAEDHVSLEVFEKTSLKKIPIGTPLIVVRGMILAHTVPMALTGREVAINQDMKAIRFDDAIDPVFGFWCLKVQHNQILGRVSTAAHGTKRLDMENLGAVPIFAPREKAQRAFVAIVEKFDSSRTQMVNAHQEAEDMFAALSQRAFRGDL